MQITQILWIRRFLEKIDVKHHLRQNEVEEVLFSLPIIRKAARGDARGDVLYEAKGRTLSGRYVIVFFIYKGKGLALPISARDMDNKEKRAYENQV